MKKEWSNSWGSSVQPRKQRKYIHNAPLHLKHRLLSVHLNPVLRERYGTRAIVVRKGDKVKVMRGSSKGFSGSVERISLKNTEIFIEGLKVKKVDGTEILKSMKPSNLMIIEIASDDKKRQAKLMKTGKPETKKIESKKENVKKNVETKSAPTKKEVPKKPTEKKSTVKKNTSAGKSNEVKK